MKKSMIVTGAISCLFLAAGVLLKYRHAPGAALLIPCGLLMAGFIFMPLLFTVWVDDKKRLIDKLALGVGILAWMSVVIGVLFKIEHWPGATVLFYSTPAILLLGYLPANYIAGISGADSKVNTLATSALIIMGCGSFFSLTMTPQSARIIDIRNTANYVRAEKMLLAEKELVEKQKRNDTAKAVSTALDDQIYNACEGLKICIVEHETGSKTINVDFENKGNLIADNHSVSPDYFEDNGPAQETLKELEQMISEYNERKNLVSPLPQTSSLFDKSEYRHAGAKASIILSDLVQIQVAVLQNERGGS